MIAEKNSYIPILLQIFIFPVRRGEIKEVEIDGHAARMGTREMHTKF